MTSLIHKTDNIEINSLRKSHTYSITSDVFFSEVFSLYNIPHTSPNREIIQFEAKSVISLENWLLTHKKLSGDAVLKLIYDIGFIIKTLEKSGTGILAFSLEDIVIINGEIFMFSTPSKIVPIKNGELVLKHPIPLLKSFISPEVKLDKLPIKCDLGFSYHSFGLLVLFLVTQKRYSEQDQFSNGSGTDILSDLRELCGTKLHYFILRCIQEKRFLFI